MVILFNGLSLIYSDCTQLFVSNPVNLKVKRPAQFVILELNELAFDFASIINPGMIQKMFTLKWDLSVNATGFDICCVWVLHEIWN